ncbi:DUF2384 domain-containing protein [Collimonas silvisoli]|uniref:DUF2384 domain-containing protein n=1 Tax=Collimonas silvisoli TaxID=2825884 RepID=UPI002E77609B|nr:DUF2384 domain-containing protein [Collimonas silvisoli]
MSITESTPIFGANFERFMSFLQDAGAGPATISPRRFGQVLDVDMHTLAASAHVHRNTISRAPSAESVQRYLRESVQVLCAAADLSGSVENAIFWFKNDPLPTFDCKTPQDLVSEDRTKALIRYIQSLKAGFTG